MLLPSCLGERVSLPDWTVLLLSQAKDLPTFKDNDFLNEGQKLHVGEESKKNFLEKLKRDVEVLPHGCLHPLPRSGPALTFGKWNSLLPGVYWTGGGVSSQWCQRGAHLQHVQMGIP